VGISQGYATLGRISVEGGFDYAAIGAAIMVASRLCDEAHGKQISFLQRIGGAVGVLVESETMGGVEP
jgi:adenylate cyclase